MKKPFLLCLGLLLLLVSCNEDSKIGKSMGRWKDFGFESMSGNRKSGLEYIEVTMNNVIQKDPAGASGRARKIMSEIEQSGLEVWSVHMPYSRTLDISVLDDSLRHANVSFMADMIRVAAVFSPKYLVLHPSSEPVAPEEREQRLKNSHESIGILAPVAEEIGAELCIENLPRTCLGQNAEEMKRLTEGYPGVGICFDTNHLMYQSHSDFLAGLEPGMIKTVHLSDYDFENERHWIPGQGFISWPEVWKGIRANGYNGIMMFECYAEPDELKAAREILLDEDYDTESYCTGLDSLAFVNASWEKNILDRGAEVSYAQVRMFRSAQSISVLKYPADSFATAMLHRPGDSVGKTSELAAYAGAAFAINGGYFDVKKKTPSVYFREGSQIYGHTYPSEVYRVDGVIGIDDRSGIHIAECDTASYDDVAGKWHTVMATGPVLMLDDEITVPVESGDGDSGQLTAEAVAAGAYSTAQFFDRRHPRTAFGTDGHGYVYYIVIDGRFKGKADGASIFETAYICHLLGMKDAINLDGGGSSTLWASETGVVNYPYDNKRFDHEGERKVPNIIYAY